MFFIYSNRALIEALLERDLSAYQTLMDLLGMLRLYEEENPKEAHRINKVVRENAAREAVKRGSLEFFQLHKAALLFDAPVEFDAYMQYVEIDRAPKERFYLPRRKVLKRVVDGMQKLADDELDTLFVSMPARVGKTTLCIFYLTWLIGRDPERSNLASAYGDKLTKSFYDGVLEIIGDPNYLYADVFPMSRLVDTNSKEETLDFGRKKRYKSLTCRSIDGALNGSCDCNGLLYGDDLVSGIEEALSNDRMETLWGKITNNLLRRQKHGSKSLFVGTRWSVLDPIGRLIDLYESHPDYEGFRYEVINLPALNDDGESNFDYDYNVGFDTRDFLRVRASMDEASWLAQCMGQPIERYGLLFDPERVRYYSGTLPDGEPDRIIAACDVAWGGGDSLSMPIGYLYGEDCYVVDVVFNTGDKLVTRPIVEARLMLHTPHFVRFEANNGGHEYAEIVDRDLKEQGIRLNITAMNSPSNVSKLTRILQEAPEIIEHFYFLTPNAQTPEYRRFMKELLTFSQLKKNKHDDAPDSLAMLNTMKTAQPQVQVFKRPF